jgi:hypothetical protein
MQIRIRTQTFHPDAATGTVFKRYTYLTSVRKCQASQFLPASIWFLKTVDILNLLRRIRIHMLVAFYILSFKMFGLMEIPVLVKSTFGLKTYIKSCFLFVFLRLKLDHVWWQDI